MSDCPPALQIRRLEPGEGWRIRACLAAAFSPYRDSYTEALFADTVPSVENLEQRCRQMTVLVACTADGEVVGTISYAVIDEVEAHLRGMAVVPDRHGCGVASRLLDTAESELRAVGCTLVTLDTTEPLRRAVAFYEKQGYRESGKRQTSFGMPLIEYSKRL